MNGLLNLAEYYDDDDDDDNEVENKEVPVLAGLVNYNDNNDDTDDDEDNDNNNTNDSKDSQKIVNNNDTSKNTNKSKAQSTPKIINKVLENKSDIINNNLPTSTASPKLKKQTSLFASLIRKKATIATKQKNTSASVKEKNISNDPYDENFSNSSLESVSTGLTPNASSLNNVSAPALMNPTIPILNLPKEEGEAEDNPLVNIYDEKRTHALKKRIIELYNKTLERERMEKEGLPYETHDLILPNHDEKEDHQKDEKVRVGVDEEEEKSITSTTPISTSTTPTPTPTTPTPTSTEEKDSGINGEDTKTNHPTESVSTSSPDVGEKSPSTTPTTPTPVSPLEENFSIEENFGVEKEVDQECSYELQAKFKKWLVLKFQGKKYNDNLMKNKAYKNPYIMKKLINFLDLKEIGTNFPKDKFDPSAFPLNAYYKELAKQADHKPVVSLPLPIVAIPPNSHAIQFITNSNLINKNITSTTTATTTTTAATTTNLNPSILSQQIKTAAAVAAAAAAVNTSVASGVTSTTTTLSNSALNASSRIRKSKWDVPASEVVKKPKLT